MNRREKTLLALVGTMLVAGLLYVLIFKLYVERARDLDLQIRELTTSVNDLVAQNRKEDGYQVDLKRLAAQTYDTDELKASEEARVRLIQLLAVSGLANDSLSLKPVTGMRSLGAYAELGWYVHARGRLSNVIDFLFLAGSDPRLHRLDNLTVMPTSESWRVVSTSGGGGSNHGPGDVVDMQVKYGTLVLLAPKGGKPPAEGVKLIPLPGPDLDGPGRKAYQLIVSRDILRPYVPRSPLHETVVAATMPDSPESHLKVVALPSADARPEIFVSDTSTQKLSQFQPGDTLAGARIVMVDYRPLPRHDKPFLVAGSRLILLIDRAFWAVDLGAVVADRYRLDPGNLPPALRGELQNLPPAPAPTSEPATGPGETEQVGG